MFATFFHIVMICCLLGPRTFAEFKIPAESIRRFQYRQTVVQQEKRENIVVIADYLRRWSTSQIVPEALIRLYQRPEKYFSAPNAFIGSQNALFGQTICISMSKKHHPFHLQNV